MLPAILCVQYEAYKVHVYYDYTHLPLNKMAAILADDILKYISLNEKVWISIKISLEFVPKVPINNIPALLQIMAWCQPGDKPLSEPMMVYWCICVPLGLNQLTAWL